MKRGVEIESCFQVLNSNDLSFLSSWIIAFRYLFIYLNYRVLYLSNPIAYYSVPQVFVFFDVQTVQQVFVIFYTKF